MSSPHIAIVTYNWPPRNAVGTHRPYTWAKYWAERGAKVTVITATKQSFDAPLDLFLPTLEGITVLEIPYNNTSAVLGQRLLRIPVMRRLAKVAKLWLQRKAGLTLDVREAWRMAAFDVAQSVAEKVDLVVSTFGPSASHLIAFDMKRHNLKLKWIADYRDLWSQIHSTELTPKQIQETRRIEVDTVGAYADLITAVSEDMVDQLSKLTGKRAILIPNGFDIDESVLRARLYQPKKPISNPMRIVYTGMLYEGMRNPEPLLQALLSLRNKGEIAEGRITVDFYGERIDLARRLAKRPEYAPFIRPMGHVPRDQALAAQEEADLLLILESPEPGAKGVLTGKVFEYMVSGTPILCLGSKVEYELPRLLKSSGTGIALEQDVDAIRKLITNMLENGTVEDFYNPDLTQILKYSRRAQALDLYSELESF